MINLMVNLEGMDYESVKAVRRLAYHAESRLDDIIATGEAQDWPEDTMAALRDQLDQSIKLWHECAKIAGGEYHGF